MPYIFCCKQSQSGRAEAMMTLAGPFNFKARTGVEKGFRRGSDD